MATDKLAAELLAGLEGVTPGPWKVYDGCSWRRIGTAHGRRDDCAVLAPTTASDGHPDLTCSRGNDRDANLEHIARCDPDSIRALLEERSTDKATISALEAENKRLREAVEAAYEDAASIADEEASRRLAFSAAAAKGRLDWGDPDLATVAQAHKSVTARALAASIRDRARDLSRNRRES